MDSYLRNFRAEKSSISRDKFMVPGIGFLIQLKSLSPPHSYVNFKNMFCMPIICTSVLEHFNHIVNIYST